MSTAQVTGRDSSVSLIGLLSHAALFVQLGILAALLLGCSIGPRFQECPNGTRKDSRAAKSLKLVRQYFGVRPWHNEEPVTDASLDPTGRKLVLGHKSGRVSVWSTTTGHRLWCASLTPSSAGLDSRREYNNYILASLQPGSFQVAAYDQRNRTVYGVSADGRNVIELEHLSDPLARLEFAPAGDKLVLVSTPQPDRLRLTVLSYPGGQTTYKQDVQVARAAKSIAKLAISEDGHSAAIATDSGIVMFDLRSSNVQPTWLAREQDTWYRFVDFNLTSDRIYWSQTSHAAMIHLHSWHCVSLPDRKEVWSKETVGEFRADSTIHLDRTSAVIHMYRPTGDAGQACTIDAMSGAPSEPQEVACELRSGRFCGARQASTCVFYHTVGTLAEMHVFDASAGYPALTGEEPDGTALFGDTWDGEVSSLDIAIDGTEILIGRGDGTAWTADVNTTRLSKQYAFADRLPVGVAAVRELREDVTIFACGDQVLAVERLTGRVLRTATYTHPTSSRPRVAVVRDDAYRCAVVSSKSRIQIVNFETQEKSLSIGGNEVLLTGFRNVVFIYSEGSRQNSLALMRLEEDQSPQVIVEDVGEWAVGCFSSSGGHAAIVTGSYEGDELRIRPFLSWFFGTERPSDVHSINKVESSAGPATCYWLDDQAKYLVIGTLYGGLYCYSVASGKLIGSDEAAHQGAITALTGSNSLGVLVSGSTDGTVRTWSIPDESD